MPSDGRAPFVASQTTFVAPEPAKPLQVCSHRPPASTFKPKLTDTRFGVVSAGKPRSPFFVR